MNAARQLIPVIPTPLDTSAERAAIDEGAERTAKLWKLFDAVVALGGYSDTGLLEAATPGATDALRTWAATLGHQVKERTITPPGVPPFVVVEVRISEHGPRITVQGAAVVS